MRERLRILPKVTQVTFSPEPNEKAPQKGFFIWLTLADDFRTVDWVKEYPFPSIALKEIQSLLSTHVEKEMLN